MVVEVGNTAPEFKLSSTMTKDEKLSLNSFINKKNVLIAFYPLNFTPG